MLSSSAAGRLSAGIRTSSRTAALARSPPSLAASAPRNLTTLAGSSAAALRLASRRTAPLTLRTLLAPLTPSLFYTTERIIALRSGRHKDSPGFPKSVYDATRETENCGVGLVASLKSVASRKVVEDANEMLVRMSHRGGVGCCPASGDGAGELNALLLYCYYYVLYCIVVR